MHETTSQPPTETTATPAHRPGTEDEKRAARAHRADTEARARIERQATMRDAALVGVGRLTAAAELVKQRVEEGAPAQDVASALQVARRAITVIQHATARDGRVQLRAARSAAADREILAIEDGLS